MITPLFLLALANGTPVLAALLLKDWGNIPVDRGLFFPDGYPLFGPSKTVRGVGLAIIATAFAAPFFKLSWTTGALFGFWAMVGDLLSSFTKRRFGFTSSYNAPGLDHIPESFLPLWFLRSELGLNWNEVAAIILAFALLDLLLWHLLHRFYPRLQSR
jgi:hypothetical protein